MTDSNQTASDFQMEVVKRGADSAKAFIDLISQSWGTSGGVITPEIATKLSKGMRRLDADSEAAIFDSLEDLYEDHND